jgi:hypothetical protein
VGGCSALRTRVLRAVAASDLCGAVLLEREVSFGHISLLLFSVSYVLPAASF